ncbi:single-stranded DNA-binding protein [Dethiothermospora halolimnae]|uniref:single-stranded DNA-binding protein n=1 Tax=Dethiothermospora halolimnae TaxID=3114390 RepID=UPI003CCBE23E
MNNVILIGRLTADPELRFLPESGRAVTKFSLAVDKGLSREKRMELEQKGIPTADFPRIVVWGRQAENCATYLTKGRMVAIQGRIQTGSYENSQGQRVYTTDVVANNVQFLEWGDNNNNQQGQNTNTNKNTNTGAPGGGIETEGFQPIDDDDIPF